MGAVGGVSDRLDSTVYSRCGDALNVISSEECLTKRDQFCTAHELKRVVEHVLSGEVEASFSSIVLLSVYGRVHTNECETHTPDDFFYDRILQGYAVFSCVCVCLIQVFGLFTFSCNLNKRFMKYNKFTFSYPSIIPDDHKKCLISLAFPLFFYM